MSLENAQITRRAATSSGSLSIHDGARSGVTHDERLVSEIRGFVPGTWEIAPDGSEIVFVSR
jgi:hypothetical protein